MWGLVTIGARVRSWRLHKCTQFSEADLARWINPIVRGWMSYYGEFYRSALYPLLAHQCLPDAVAAEDTQTVAEPAEGPRGMGKGRGATPRVLRPVAMGHLGPTGLVIRTTRAV
jgi:Group II intron, maturase-specific domain